MRLNSIKLSGFKSFAEPTHFQLPGQLVGVVGPNGCGKSNIMDAVRWVLGESKASELRGESMQDVIFNGSGNRKPASRSSVELVFDNADARAGGQWNQFTEIAVKRVLTRYLGFKEDLASSRVEKELWAIAQTMLPQRDVKHTMPRYTQGVMDLGATVCTPKKPQCAQCPLADACVAKAEGQPEAYPVKTRKLKRTSEQLWLLHIETHFGDVWLTQRPQTGVWAGLYCLPVFENFEALQAALPAKYHAQLHEGAVFKHVLTHKDLHLHPVQLSLPSAVKLAALIGEGQWVAQADWPSLGLPAPIRKLLVR